MILNMTHDSLKNFLNKQKIEYEDTEELWSSISEKEHNNMLLYNYKDYLGVPRNNPVIMVCRGLVLTADGDVLCYPFNRFFNDFEAECLPIMWESAKMYEKVDGSLLNVWWAGTQWEVTTRGSFYYNVQDTNFKQLFLKLFSNFEGLNKNNTYMFELVTRQNRIVTHYDEEFVVLLGVRNNTTLKEYSNTDIDVLASRLEILRPNKYDAKDITSCRLLFEGLKDDEEGFVVVDEDFNRMKMKQESYFQLSKIVNLNDQAIYEHVIGVKPADSELIAKLPEVQNKIKRITSERLLVKELILKAFRPIKDLASRKEFAMAVVNSPYKSMLFSLYSGNGIVWNKIKYKVLQDLLPVQPFYVTMSSDELKQKILEHSVGWEAEMVYTSFEEAQSRSITNMIVRDLSEILNLK